MNLEEKAIKEYGDDIHLWARQRDGFKVGYTQCKSDLIEFLKVNHRASVKDILKHLDNLV